MSHRGRTRRPEQPCQVLARTNTLFNIDVVYIERSGHGYFAQSAAVTDHWWYGRAVGIPLLGALFSRTFFAHFSETKEDGQLQRRPSSVGARAVSSIWASKVEARAGEERRWREFFSVVISGAQTFDRVGGGGEGSNGFEAKFWYNGRVQKGRSYWSVVRSLGNAAVFSPETACSVPRASPYAFD